MDQRFNPLRFSITYFSPVPLFGMFARVAGVQLNRVRSCAYKKQPEVWDPDSRERNTGVKGRSLSLGDGVFFKATLRKMAYV